MRELSGTSGKRYLDVGGCGDRNVPDGVGSAEGARAHLRCTVAPVTTGHTKERTEGIGTRLVRYISGMRSGVRRRYHVQHLEVLAVALGQILRVTGWVQ